MRNTASADTEIRDMFFELLNKFGEFSEYVRNSGLLPACPDHEGSYFAFDPEDVNDKDYYRKLVLYNCINAVLNESGISVKSRGYTYLRDAICIVIDLKRLDICLTKEVYPLIVKKHKIKGKYIVEHNIRNAIEAAFLQAQRNGSYGSPMRSFDRRPTNKEFILTAAERVQDMLAGEMQD